MGKQIQCPSREHCLYIILTNGKANAVRMCKVYFLFFSIFSAPNLVEVVFRLDRASVWM